MAKARYEIHVPNHARQVGLAAQHYLENGPINGIHSTTVQFGHPHDSLTVLGEESPELDSHIKQTGTFIGDVANVPVINVSKQGKNLAHWPMRNLNYQPQPPVDTVSQQFDRRPDAIPLGSEALHQTNQPL